jgi:hypothetical protein
MRAGHEVVVVRAGRLGDHGGDRGGPRLPPHTGTTIRDAETGGVAGQNRVMMRALAGARR